MSLFGPNFKKEIQKLISKVESEDFQLPDNWALWNKKEESLRAIEEADVEIIKEIKKLYKKGHSNRRLTSEILRLATESRHEIKEMRKKLDLEHQSQQAQHINSLIAGLDAFLNEELTIETLGVETHNLVLYHGSATPGITDFSLGKYGENIHNTVGIGLYLTHKQDAEGYAKLRAINRKVELGVTPTPVVYQFKLPNLWLADLRNISKIRVLFAKFVEKLEKILDEPDIHWVYEHNLRKSIESIRSDTWRGLGAITGPHSPEFTKFLKDHNYDGVIAREGGEKGVIGNHESYVIFDPSKVKLLKEIQLKAFFSAKRT